MSDDLDVLLANLNALHKRLRDQSYERYCRINPFYEDIFDWKERGEYWEKDDKGITIYNSTTVVGDVEIGENTWIGPFVSLDGTGGLKIGRFCSISAGVQMNTHDTVKWALTGGKADPELGPVAIGDCCFIGTHSIVTKGVSIGEHSVVGAGAVVTRDVPAFSIVAGVPARTIGTVSFSDDGGVTLNYQD